MAAFKKPAKRKPRINKNLKCALCSEGVKEVAYKDVYRLNKFLTRRGKIIARVRTGNCYKHQNQLAQAVKIARFMALLPYTSTV